MDLVWYRRYRRGGGDRPLLEWEFAAGLNGWQDAPVPAQVGKRVAEGFLGRELPVGAAMPMTNLVHWSYGLFWGACYGILAGSTKSASPVLGPPFAAGIMAMEYTVLPLGTFYKPIWQYDIKTLWQDFSAHFAFGLALATAFNILRRI